MKLIESFLVNNDCFKQGRKITVKGLMLHSIGVPQPSAKGIIENWNKPGIKKCVHAIIEPDGDVFQCMHWNMRGWHGGGASNDSYIGVEMTEPATIRYVGGANWIEKGDGTATKAHVVATYKTAIELFAYLCKEFKLDPLADGVILSHSGAHKRGIASAHGDVEHIWSKLGLTMPQFRRDIKAAIEPKPVSVNASLLDLLMKNKIISNQGYWLKRMLEDNSTYQLLTNMANYIKKGGKV